MKQGGVGLMLGNYIKILVVCYIRGWMAIIHRARLSMKYGENEISLVEFRQKLLTKVLTTAGFMNSVLMPMVLLQKYICS
jgi:hypothetical protein